MTTFLIEYYLKEICSSIFLCCSIGVLLIKRAVKRVWDYSNQI